MGILLAIGVPAGLALIATLWFTRQLAWLRRETFGDRYFARTLAERRALKREIERRAGPVNVVFAALAKLRRGPPQLRYRGVVVPWPACPYPRMEEATGYRPGPEDIFVATQMKCGTTWMQQIVYEILCRGRGDLGDDGHRHMYALSPWIESVASVPMRRAPLVGEGKKRIVKTHLPTSLCPYSDEARYVYVTRHPVACFASCVDFVRMLSGPFSFTPAQFVDWFCGDEMWWRSWPEHVEGWWRWAEERPNVLFIHYEAMLEDLAAAVDRVAAFLGVELSPEERSAVVEKSDYRYMKKHEELFEMSPPSYFNLGDGGFFRSGKADRHQDVGPETRERILAFCRERLHGSVYPVARFYPDVASRS